MSAAQRFQNLVERRVSRHAAFRIFHWRVRWAARTNGIESAEIREAEL